MESVASFRFHYQPPPARLFVYRSRETIEIAGVEGDHIFETIRNTGTFYEVELLEALARRREALDGVTVDVGSNIGNHAIYLAKFVGGPVVCIEPSPRAVRLLRMNLAANALEDQVFVVEAAAGDRKGTVAVCEAPPSAMGSSHVKDPDSSEAAVLAPMITLDGLTAELPLKRPNKVSLLKIDVEGFEDRVLEGGRLLLETDRPTVVLELSTASRRDQVSQQLERIGYKRFGPWGWTPTYVFATKWRGGLTRELHYRLWRSFSRGRLHGWASSRSAGGVGSLPSRAR